MTNNVKEKNPQKIKTRNMGDSHDGTSLRYLAMLQLIPRSPDSLSIDEIIVLLEQLGYTKDKRTIQRDLVKLEFKFGLECRTEGTKNFWSYKKNTPTKTFPDMDEHTALSFQLLNSFMQPLLPPETVKAIHPWVKISGERLSNREGVSARWKEKIHVLPLGLPRLPPKLKSNIQEEIYQATLRELSLNILYRKRGAMQPEHYLLSPLGLVIRDQITYLVAAKNETKELRYFALHRVVTAKIMQDEKFVKVADFKLKHYVDEMFGFKMGPSPTLQLKLRLNKYAAQTVEENPISAKQTLTPENASYLLTVDDAPNTFELRQWIRSMGSAAEVIEPSHLRANFKEEIAVLAKQYGKKVASSA
jgi:predicted DNA-binding transcriptional regulator YafY